MAKREELIELRTTRKSPRLTIDPQPTHSPFIRIQGRRRLRTPGRWLLALALVGGAGIVALLRLVGRTK